MVALGHSAADRDDMQREEEPANGIRKTIAATRAEHDLGTAARQSSTNLVAVLVDRKERIAYRVASADLANSAAEHGVRRRRNDHIASEGRGYWSSSELVEVQTGRMGRPKPDQLDSDNGHSGCDRGCHGEVRVN